MSELIYLDLLQMVTPGEQLDSSLFDFYVFGSFDALKVEFEYSISDGTSSTRRFNSLHDLHTISKKRRLSVPARFDKQSMHLYALDENAEYIFSKEGMYASYPLVLTLIQLDDYCIDHKTPKELVDSFKEELKKLQDSEDLKSIVFEVFFCLGEPDLVIVFRNSSVAEIARLIYRIRILSSSNLLLNKKGICVLSTSSHCAFPNNSNHQNLKNSLKKWADSEPDMKFFTLFNTSYGLDDNTKKDISLSEQVLMFDKMLLGDWDYIREWNGNNASEFLLDLILEPVVQFNSDGIGSFKSSCSIPVINLTNADLSYARSDRKLSSIQTTNLSPDYVESSTVFSVLSDKIKNLTDVYGSLDVTSNLSESVVSMHSTLVGILKHLCQLRDGRFQYDLYSFVRPAFDALPDITKNTCELIECIQNEFNKCDLTTKNILLDSMNETISNLLDSYIHDTSRLLTELHHLFSVLSISPHTYMESYGSNMRSITATCKLLVAYQGIAYSLSKHFDMTIYKEDGEAVSANEVMLVIPYRRIHQTTRVLFEFTSPENRIVYIRINASDMFRVQKTLFMLLHECGHHILSHDFRDKRVKHYYDAYSGYMLDLAFGSVYKDPFISVQMPKIDYRMPLENVSENSKFHIKYTSEEAIREAIIKTISEHKIFGDKLLSYWENDYKTLPRQIVLAEPIALKNNFLHYIKEAACYYMSVKINKFKTSEDNDIYSKDDLGQLLIDIVSNEIIGIFSDVLDNEYKLRLHESDNELWYITEFRTIYQTFPKEIILQTVQEVCVEIFSLNYKEVAEELKMIFSDIYSDIFAITTLGIGELTYNERKEEAEKYLVFLRDEASFRLQKEFSHNYLMIRIFAVLEGGLNLNLLDINDILRKVLSRSKEDIESLQNKIRNKIGYHYVLKYTRDLCVPDIRNQIIKSNELSAITKKLKSMYRSDADQQGLTEMMDAVYYFWRASTQRT